MAAAAPKPNLQIAADQLAVLRRWCYRSASQKSGELFFSKTFDDRNSTPEWPIKPLLRGVSRVFTGQQPPAFQSESAPQSTIRPGD